MSKNILLLSIKPCYAEKIFNGTKKVELRKTKPRLSFGDEVIVYVSSPVKELHGSFRVVQIVAKPIDELWALVSKDAGVTKVDFYNYYEGAKIGYGIFFDKPKLISAPLALAELRMIWSGFHPPQSYRYLKLNEAELINMKSSI